MTSLVVSPVNYTNHNDRNHISVAGLFFKSILIEEQHSLGGADIKLRHAKGKIAENTVYTCALLIAHAVTHGTKGEKESISRMSDQANMLAHG